MCVGGGGFTPLRQGVTQWFFCGCECGRHVERHPGGVSLSARVCVSGTLRSSLQPLFFLPPGGQQPPSGATYPIPTVTRRLNEYPPPTRLRSPAEVMFNHIMLTWITKRINVPAARNTGPVDPSGPKPHRSPGGGHFPVPRRKRSDLDGEGPPKAAAVAPPLMNEIKPACAARPAGGNF